MKIKVNNKEQAKPIQAAPAPPMPPLEAPNLPPEAMASPSASPVAAPPAPIEDNLRLSAAQYCQLYGVNRTLAAGFCCYVKTKNAPMRQGQQAWGELLEQFKNYPVA